MVSLLQVTPGGTTRLERGPSRPPPRHPRPRRPWSSPSPSMWPRWRAAATWAATSTTTRPPSGNTNARCVPRYKKLLNQFFVFGICGGKGRGVSSHATYFAVSMKADRNTTAGGRGHAGLCWPVYHSTPGRFLSTCLYLSSSTLLTCHPVILSIFTTNRPVYGTSKES